MSKYTSPIINYRVGQDIVKSYPEFGIGEYTSISA
jgi:hypothetical protein